MKKIISYAAILLMCLSGTLYATQASAHALEQSYIFFDIEDDRVFGHIDLTVADINNALGLSLPTDQSLNKEQLKPYLDQIVAYVRENTSMSVDSGPNMLPLTDTGLESMPLAQYIQLNFSFDDLKNVPREIDVRFSVLFDVKPEHRNMAIIQTYWKTGTFNDESNVALIFSPGNERQTIDLSSSSVWSGFAALIGMGVHHIWIGIDHILFLLALLLPAVVVRDNGKWQRVGSFRAAFIHVVKVVSVFTLAHTITLSLAALNAISLSSRFVESVIALSIAVAAFDIIKPIFKQRIWWIVFAFGLFHGFGFASVLGELGIPSNYMVHSLLGFNVGVELGQIVIVMAIFPVLFLLSKHWTYVKAVLPVGAGVLIAISLYWFVERAFVIDLPAGAVVNHIIAWFH